MSLRLESGARDIVLVGYGSGGTVALMFLRESVWAEQVSGVVLDSAYLDPGSMVDARTAADNVPGFLVGLGQGHGDVPLRGRLGGPRPGGRRR